MARKRQIDPGIWTSEQFINLRDPWARLLFIGMFSTADDEGLLKGSPAFLKTTIFPGDSISLDDIKNWRDQISEQILIRVYNVDNQDYIWIIKFLTYQYISKPYPSKLPPPPYDIIPEPFPNHSSTVPVLQHSIGIGIGNNRNGNGMVTELVIKDTNEVKNISDIWNLAKQILEGTMSKSNYQTWINEMAAVGSRNGSIVFSTPSIIAAENISNRFRPQIEKCLTEILGYKAEITVVNAK
jgi:hypothetical protein